MCESFIREGYENESQDHNHAVKTAKRILNYAEAESREIWRAQSVKANREDIKLLCDRQDEASCVTETRAARSKPVSPCGPL